MIRHAELSRILAPFVEEEAGEIASNLAEMFGAYRSMRQTGTDAIAMISSVMNSLKTYPAWAIVKACKDIKTNGIWRDGKFDKRWAPNDCDIVDTVRREVGLYTVQHQSATAILSATVETKEHHLG